jgi:tetratricopeptide (TPR) repeat protein
MKDIAYEFYNYGDDKEAIKAVNKFIDRYPKSKYGRNLLATLYYWQGDLSKSKALLHAVLKDGEFSQSLALLKKIELKNPQLKNRQIEPKKSVVVSDGEVRELFKYVKAENSVSEALDIRKSAFEKLNNFYADKKYNEFLNLYTSLENSNILMPTYLNVNALYCAIKLQEYKKAKRILHIYKMPENEHLEELEKLVDKKLLKNRFTSF